jgi:bacillithiol biosynthesis cysteine-adding enzyme BshC
MRQHLSEYVANAADLGAFFAKPPKALFDSPPVARAWDPQLVQGIRQYQQDIGATTAFEGNEAAVVTGQQPGLFTGPLYAIYKAATAIRLAEKLTRGQGVPCVPVYWVGSEDHDFEEASPSYFLTKNHGVLSLRYAPASEIDSLPMNRVPVEASLHDFIDRAASETPGAEFRDEVAQFLHESLDASASLAEWTARLLARIFRDTPLVFFAPHIAEARRVGAAILRREIEEPLYSTGLLNETGRQLESLGFPPQVTKGATECNFFLEVEGKRAKVVFEKGRFRIGEAQFDSDEVLALLDATPDRFSPNVALRCIVQQYLFPTAAYVAGPGELAYWAQLKPMFEHFGETMPVVYPRARAVLTTMKLDKLLAKLGLSSDDVAEHKVKVLERALRSTSKDPAFVLLNTERETIEAALNDLSEGLKAHNKSASAMVAGLGKDVVTKFDRIERTILDGDKARRGAVEKQIARLQNSLMPLGKPQERVFNIFSYFFEYGWGLLPRIVKELDVESFAMNTIEL